MPYTVEDYKGHTITIDVSKVGGGWQGSYQINVEPIKGGEDRPHPTEELACREALDRAKRVIDARKY